MLKTIVVIFVAALLFAGGCRDNGPRISAPGTEVGRETVGAEGGKVVAENGSLIINIPEGALEDAVEISITRIADDELPVGGVPRTGFEIKPDGIEFEKPIELTIRYRLEDLPRSEVQWLRVIQVLENKQLGPTQFVTHQEGEGWVRGRLSHFSKYALADLQVAEAVVTNAKKKITKLDVLFVIDNSGSMGEEQANLTNNFPKFIDQLDKVGLDYRLGVISTDLGAGSYTTLPQCEIVGGDGGKLQNEPRVAGCTPPPEAWIDGAGKSKQQVVDAFSCIAKLGVGGCGFEHALEAMHKALDPAVNPGFIRQDAGLAIVIISDEDDCSASKGELFDPTQVAETDTLGPITSFRCFQFGITCDVNDRSVGPRNDCVPDDGPDSYLYPIQRYVDRVNATKANGAIVVAAIAGALSPVAVEKDGSNAALVASCESAAGVAVPPIRIAAFVDAFGSRGTMEEICAEDFGPTLDKVGNLVVSSSQLGWCLPFEPFDTDPQTLELDGDCVVVGDALGELMPCSSGEQTPCYDLLQSPSCGKSKAMIELHNLAVDQLGDAFHATCLVP